MFSETIYESLEQIVSPENMSDDPAILDTDAFNWLAGSHPLLAPGKQGYGPEAVILPASLEAQGGAC